MQPKDRFLREPDVTSILNCSSPTIRRLEKKGLFPKRRRIGTRAVGWLESEVMDWLAKRDQADIQKNEGQNG